MGRKRNTAEVEPATPEIIDGPIPNDYGVHDWIWFPVEQVVSGAPQRGLTVPAIRYCPSCGSIQDEPMQVQFNPEGTVKFKTCSHVGCGVMFAVVGVQE